MSNFDFLKNEMSELFSLAVLAEDMLYVDAASCIVKQCIIVEKIVNIIISNENLPIGNSSSLNTKINLLYKEGVFDLNQKKNLDKIREERNIAAHNGIGNQVEALITLEKTYAFVTWFYTDYSNLSGNISPFSIPERKNIVINVEEIEKQFSYYIQEIENSIKKLNDNKKGRGSTISYTFNGTNYTNIHNLSKALLTDLNSAKKHIRAGTLTSYFRETDTDLAVKCFELETNAKVTNKEIYAFIYQMTSEHDGLIWNEHYWKDFNELGQEGIKAFCSNDQPKIEWINKMFKDGILEFYLEMKAANSNAVSTSVKTSVEKLLYELCDISYFYWDGYRFRSDEGLIRYLDSWNCVDSEKYKSIINQLDKMKIFNIWIEKYYKPIDMGMEMFRKSIYQVYKAGHTQFFEMYNNRALKDSIFINNIPILMKMKVNTIVCLKHNHIMTPVSLKIRKSYGNTFHKSIGVMYCSKCKQYYCSEQTQEIILKEHIPIKVINYTDE